MMHSCGIRIKVQFVNDVIFIAFCICGVMINKICWPTTKEHVSLGMNILEFQGCIKLINEITIEIHKPWNNDLINHRLIDVKAYIA